MDVNSVQTSIKKFLRSTSRHSHNKLKPVESARTSSDRWGLGALSIKWIHDQCS